jgi:hypothetical protein
MDKTKFKRIVLAAGTSALLVGTIAVPAFAATDGGATTATVNAVISVTAPATLAFGAGAPGSTVSVVDAPVTVITNNAAGYTLAIQATPMTGPGTAIPVSALSFRNAATAFAPLVTASIDVVLASTTAMTDADGTTHDIDANLALPWIAPGDYEGTFIFTASNL